ncbi:MAG: MFS transporter [Chitinophagaceae bacterium]|jgi:UMF1 family MFS transporter|nr:MFS transporter [Chitinophagaceae bacterium]
MAKTSKKMENAWVMYDWANSAYNLVITSTIFPAYYVGITASKVAGEPAYVDFFGFRIINTVLQDYALGVVFMIVAITSPILSSIADYRRNKRVYLRWLSLLGALSCSLLFFFTPQRIEYGIIVFAFAALGYWSSLVFYNSYLPDIVPPEERDRVSAKGFAMGYFGSVLLQVLCFVIILKPGLFGLDASDKTLGPRISFLLVGFWWFGFAQITLRAMPLESRAARKARTNVFTNGFIELKKVWNQVQDMPTLKRFLLSFFLYSLGVQTVMLVAAGFAKKEIFPDPKDEPKLLITIIIIQLIAIPGALIMSRLTRVIGNLWVLILSVVIWIGVTYWAHGLRSQTELYFLAGIIGLVMGGIQAISRSTYAKLIPVTQDTTSYFSFYDVTEKVALFIGLFVFGAVEHFTGNIRNSVLFLTVFFIFGLLALFYTKAAPDYRKHASIQR